MINVIGGAYVFPLADVAISSGGDERALPVESAGVLVNLKGTMNNGHLLHGNASRERCATLPVYSPRKLVTVWWPLMTP